MKKCVFFKNFFKGYGSILNLFPQPIEIPKDTRTDAEKIRSDWERVGQDMYKAIGTLTNGRESSKRNK